MSVRMDIEELQTTKTEKFLAGVLAVFCLMAGVWAYQKIDDYVADQIRVDAPASAADEAAIRRLDRARSLHGVAQGRARQALQNLELRREEYRTALDAGRRAPRLEQQYRAAQAAYTAAEREVGRTQIELERAAPAAQAAERRRLEQFEQRQDRRERWTFFLRLALSGAAIAASYALVFVLHRRRSRYLPLTLGAVAASTVLAFVLAGDYLTDYVDPLDLGILLLALFGAAITVLVFAALQWYVRRRIPARRVRRGQCPFCGYPARANHFCERCGREIVAECARCSAPRRVGTARCGACGAV